MSKANQFLDEDAVSPVIGVILMVAITVILAAVIAAFVFGMGPPEQAPQASLRLSNASVDGFTLEHQGGDMIKFDKINITVNGKDIGAVNSSNGSLSTGESIWINAGTPDVTDGGSVKIIDRQSQQLIGTYPTRL